MKFHDCTLIDCDQNTEAWFEQRKGLLTASAFGDWLTKSGKVAERAMVAAAAKALAEYSGFPDPEQNLDRNPDVIRGKEYEEPARQLFQKATGLTVDQIGFARSKHGYFGCSPDGLILDTGEGLEIKVPRASKLIQYIEDGGLPDQYKAQVHGSMAVTGAKAWHFFAWHPGFPYFHVRVERDEYTEKMLEGLKDYSRYFESLAAKMAAMQEEQNTNDETE